MLTTKKSGPELKKINNESLAILIALRSNKLRDIKISKDF
jgi:hypothetical protein